MRFNIGIALAALAQFASLGNSHFVLQYPISLGYTDSTETTAPCGGYTVTDRSKGVANWPLGGQSIKVITTHTSVTWEYRAALLSNPTGWVSLAPILTQTGVGNFCEPQIPGYAPWVDQDAVLQVIQHAPDGALYQVRKWPLLITAYSMFRLI